MLNRDFKEFVELLNSSGVEYLVVGGYALAAYGHPRYTGDLDIWFRATPTNVQGLLDALDAFGFGSLGLTSEDFLRAGSVIQLGYPPARIDLLSAIDGVSFDDCYPRRQIVRVDALDLPLINETDFRINKRAAGRAKDLADIESLGDSSDSKPPD